MIISMLGPVTPVTSFPRPEFFEDLDLDVGGFAALLGTAFEKLFKVINVLPIAVQSLARSVIVTKPSNQAMSCARFMAAAW